MAVASGTFTCSEAGPSTPRKASKESCGRNALEAPEIDETLHTPLLEIPAHHSTPELNWSEVWCKFKAVSELGSPDPETPNPVPCGGSQAFAAWSRPSAPLSMNTDASHCWQQCLSNLPPCPLPLRISHIVESSSRLQGDAVESRQPCAPHHSSFSSSIPGSLTSATSVQRLPSPWNPVARLGAGGILLEDKDPCTPRNSHTPPRKSTPMQSTNEITPRKLVCSRDSTPPPTRRSSPPSTKRSSPPFSLSRRSPLRPTPSAPSSRMPKLTLELLDEVESPWKLHKVDTSSDEETDDSSLFNIRSPQCPPVFGKSLPWGGDLDASLSPAAKQGQENCDPNSGRFHRDFRDVTAFGKGKFSTVYRAENKTDRQIYAVRTQETANVMERQMLMREVATIAAIRSEGPVCPHVLQYFSAWLEDASFHVQTELFECSLRDRLETNRQLPCYRSNPQETLALLRDVADGLAALHERGLAHTDVRPENIFVTKQGSFKVGGLGRCARLSVLGPPPIPAGDDFATDHFYRAPEALWLGGDFTEVAKADVFSCALVVCEFAMCPGALPGDSCEWQQLRIGCLSALLISRMPEALVMLLRRMLIIEPSERPGCCAIAEHAEELKLAAGHFEPLEGLSEAALISSLRKQREEDLREGLRQAVEAEEFQRKRAEALRLEVEAMKKRVAQQSERASLESNLHNQCRQSRLRSSSWEPKQAQESHGRPARITGLP